MKIKIKNVDMIENSVSSMYLLLYVLDGQEAVKIEIYGWTDYRSWSDGIVIQLNSRYMIVRQTNGLCEDVDPKTSPLIEIIE